MFALCSRRYTGAKTKLLKAIDCVLLKHFDYTKYNALSFFDVFAGTGVVGEYFLQKHNFTHFILNDFLESNFVIYQGFFSQTPFSQTKLTNLAKDLENLNPKILENNYYAKHFGNTFFSQNNALVIGAIRERLDVLLHTKQINQKEFYILLSSLLYSSDRVANTVGHYDAYRKNIPLKDAFKFELIQSIKTKAEIEIFKEDSNTLVKQFIKEGRTIDIAFIDPPYNSRQYSRFYHLLETLSQNDKPKLYGVALKPEPKNLSKYCKTEAKVAFIDLIENLAKMSKILVVTYNNTYTSKSSSSRNKIQLEEIRAALESVAKTSIYEFDHKAFSSGKTEFHKHKECVFIGKVR
ncbi:DNA adenine methylase [Helicobacter marmotae]|uniref:site-specific DNA-methyltransferase (adenine-specific) n=1 Tax=Helicobacter marmotae TaxID=152490 RepID=A0A3D8I2W0_9HELI|nr:DNA adenine methylase [Helicobacter marmotae]RDU59472.1 DNA methyltransferase [Helicobacter marmotae]